ncbi:MAG: hypothetical protein R2867_13285 [Caldilineaceae bacterium]
MNGASAICSTVTWRHITGEVNRRLVWLQYSQNRAAKDITFTNNTLTLPFVVVPFRVIFTSRSSGDKVNTVGRAGGVDL